MSVLVPSSLLVVVFVVIISSGSHSQECYHYLVNLTFSAFTLLFLANNDFQQEIVTEGGFGGAESNSEQSCSEVWMGKGVNEHAQFQTLTNRSGSKIQHRFNWRWKSHHDHGQWDVFYNDLPTKGAKSGGFYYIKPIRQKSAFLNWKLYNKTLTWVSQNRKMHLENWNLTICGLGVRIYFRSNGDQWTYQLGNIKIGGGESGDTYIDDEMFTTLRNRRQSKDIRRKWNDVSARHKRETEDLEDLDKKNVWKKLKGWFKELFDQGPDDARGWMTRIADWVLGLLERILS